jgi:hypothetical protein
MGWLLVLPPLFHHSAGLAVSGGSVSGRRTAGGGAWRAVNTIKSFLQGRCSASWRMRPRTGSLIGWLRMVAVVALEEHALPGRPGSMSQARAAAPDQTGGDLLIFRLGREGGAGDLGDIGVRGSARVLVPQSVLGYFDPCPGIVADAGDGVPDGGVHPHGDREAGAQRPAGIDHVASAEHRDRWRRRQARWRCRPRRCGSSCHECYCRACGVGRLRRA